MKKLIPVLIAVLFIAFSGNVKAQEEIPSFEATLSPQSDGTIRVEELINYDFGSADRHGIFRYIPLTSQVGDVYLTSSIEPVVILRDGRTEKYTENKSKGNINFKIGDPDKTISGQHTYKIDYVIKNQIRNYDDHDEIYWNVTGNDWPAAISVITAKIAPGFNTEITRVKCFTGVSGSLDENCDARIEGSSAVFKTKSPLSFGEGMTIVAAFPPETFPKSVYTNDPPGSLTRGQWILIGIAAVLYYLILPVLVLVWYLRNKRKNRFGPVSVNFDFPEDSAGSRIPPAEAGALDSAKLEKDDVIATIFDLAIRKYLKIEQLPEKKAFGFIPAGGPDYQIIRVKDFTDVNGMEYEKQLWERLFKTGDSVKLTDLKTDFYLTFEKMEKSLFKSLISRGYYYKNPKNQKALLTTGGIFSLISLNVILGFILFFLSYKLNGRTASGDEADWRIDGLKLFLKNMNRHYKWQAANLITAEKYIPYAIAVGFIDQFMDQLKVIYPDYKPGWYSGSSFYNSYPAFYGSMNSSVTTVSPSSSSSGFSSGGSSGGGGGGGGGGSW